jgi:hypothetical protein
MSGARTPVIRMVTKAIRAEKKHQRVKTRFMVILKNLQFVFFLVWLFLLKTTKNNQVKNKAYGLKQKED